MMAKKLNFNKITSTKLLISALFIIVLYILLSAHNFYDFIIFNTILWLKITILEFLIFLLLFSTSLLINKYLIKKQKYLKYVFLLLYIIYRIVHVIVLIDDFEKLIIASYIDFFMIIFSLMFLSNSLLCILSFFFLLKYLLLFYFYPSYYLDELIFAFNTAVLVSILILFTLKFLVRTFKSEYEMRIKDIILLMMEILELKDPYTKGHSERVAEYATILAEESRIYTKKDLENFYLACLLHDVGKIGIPDEILNKDSHLTNEEYSVIKKHSLLGAKLLNNLSFTPLFIHEHRSIIRSHHEKWDGSGYPDGLKGHEIPLNVRIVSIADAFDAMTSTRSYRNALSAEEAYKRIIEGAGTQFDPSLIETFQKVYPKWIELLKNKYNE